ncbi:MAG: NAD(P)/FAD-dependent oxidoreductase [Hyphomicrobiaceae bacterium]|nr:NAD(P)/FAD-dependent oxidoreductase [Hyphomicrobiaceae bacterium]
MSKLAERPARCRPSTGRTNMSQAPKKSWCVVGGGMLGLTLALRLAEAGHRVTVVEAAPRLGGLADAWQIGDVTWDRHYHVILQQDRHLTGLLAELGLSDKLVWSETRSDFYTDKTFYPLNNSIDFLRFPPLGLIDKFRLGATILYASRLKDGLRLEDIKLEDWLVALSGRRTFERIWRPLVRAKLGDNYHRASASYIWNVIRRFYGARQTGAQKKELFGYVQGGYETIIARLVERLQGLGVVLETGTPVTRIAAGAPDAVEVATTVSDRSFDRVVVTSASSLACRICEGLDTQERARHAGIIYQGIVCASVLLERPLRNAYITYIADEEIPYTAVIEMTAIVDKAQFGGRSLVYLPAYVPSDSPLFELTDAEIEARFMAALRGMYPDLAPTEIEAFKVSRARQVLSITTIGYSRGLPPMQTAVPGLFIVNSAHIVNAALNVNDTIKLAESALPLLQSELQSSAPARPAGSTHAMAAE